MGNLFDRFMGRKSSAAQSAKERLKFVLVTDRISISPEDLNAMQREILEVIRKYCRINENAVDLKVEQRERDSYLVADIPIAGNSGQRGTIQLQTTITVTTDEDDEETTAEKKEES